jgi:hypothetical protein
MVSCLQDRYSLIILDALEQALTGSDLVQELIIIEDELFDSCLFMEAA